MRLSLLLIPLMLLTGPSPLAANRPAAIRPAAMELNDHPVSVVEADIYVNRFKTIMRLKCFAEDLELLQGVEVLEDGFYDSEELLDATQDHAEYLAEKIQLIDASGLPMKAKITEIVNIQFPEDNDGRIPSGQLMNFQIGYTLEYSYESPPEFLTIVQQMVAEGALLPSEFKILLKQAGSDQPYVKMLKPDSPETIRFDWDKPVLSSDASEKEWEAWFDEQREKTLGITSYSSVYSFIYITHHEVRHEILIPLATLATMIDIERDDPAFLEIEEQDAAVDKIQALFASGNPVVIDGVPVSPEFDSVDFYGLDLKDFATKAERRQVSMANGRVGLILSYSTKGTPREVEVTWDQFNTAIKTVDSVVFAFDDVLKTRFTMFLEDNTYRWSEPDRAPLPPIAGLSGELLDAWKIQPQIQVPLISVAAAGIAILSLLAIPFFTGSRWLMLLVAVAFGGLAWGASGIGRLPVNHPWKPARIEIPSADASEVFGQLHKNLFRAFDYRQQSDIYDALANSVDGPLLRKLFLDINESLKVKEQGGAVSRIDAVEIVSGEEAPRSTTEPPVESRPGFDYRCQWNLVGSVEHWGHIHQRTNQYEAIFRVELIENAWKITEMSMIGDPKPGQIKTSLRKF